MACRILIADDNLAVRYLFRIWADLQPWTVEIVEDGQKALELLCNSLVD